MQWGFLDRALRLWPKVLGSRATLINLSENHTFQLDSPSGARFILRVHRPAYHSRLAIESELAWMQALRRDAGLFTPQPIAGLNAQFVQQATFEQPGDDRYMVLFEFEHGSEPVIEDDLAPVFIQLGGLAARCHAHAQHWTPPIPFERPEWSETAILNPDAIWGDWRKAPGIDAPVHAILERLDSRLRESLVAYGRQGDRFGLIHADMRLANLLVDGGVTRLIDFDDCGYCWFGYDFAAAISFYEDSPAVPELKQAWLDGYRRYRAFGPEHEMMLDALVMLRRMALLAWIGTHSETELAQSLQAVFGPVTAELAERFLSTTSIHTL